MDFYRCGFIHDGMLLPSKVSYFTNSTHEIKMLKII